MTAGRCHAAAVTGDRTRPRVHGNPGAGEAPRPPRRRVENENRPRPSCRLIRAGSGAAGRVPGGHSGPIRVTGSSRQPREPSPRRAPRDATADGRQRPGGHVVRLGPHPCARPGRPPASAGCGVISLLLLILVAVSCDRAWGVVVLWGRAAQVVGRGSSGTATRPLASDDLALDEQLASPHTPRASTLDGAGQAGFPDGAPDTESLGPLHVARRLGEEELRAFAVARTVVDAHAGDQRVEDGGTHLISSWCVFLVVTKQKGRGSRVTGSAAWRLPSGSGAPTSVDSRLGCPGR